MQKLVIALAALVLAVPAQAQQKAAPAPAGDEKTLMQMEEDLAKAVVKRDVAKVEATLAPTFAFVDPGGAMSDRAKFIGDIKGGALKIESTKNDDMKVRVYGNAAVVTYRSTDKGTFNGEDISGQYRWTDVFVKEGGKWMIVSTHGTGIAPPGPPKGMAAPPPVPAPQTPPPRQTK